GCGNFLAPRGLQCNGCDDQHGQQKERETAKRIEHSFHHATLLERFQYALMLYSGWQQVVKKKINWKGRNLIRFHYETLAPDHFHELLSPSLIPSDPGDCGRQSV